MNVRTALFILATGCVPYGCSTQASDGGSETNWYTSCQSDEDCSVGSCICGVCTTHCTTSSSCAGDTAVCVTSEGTTFRALCGAAASETAGGVCVTGCQSTGCGPGFACVGDGCVPTSHPGLDAGQETQSATVETYTFANYALNYLMTGDGYVLSGRCLSGVEGTDVDSESDCSVVEFPYDDGLCDCEARGLTSPSAETLARARSSLRQANVSVSSSGAPGLCDADGLPSCDSLCACEVPAFTGSDLQTCRNSADTFPENPLGFCLVASARGIGSPAVSEKCESKTLIRLSSDHATRFAQSCATKDTVTITAPAGSGAIGSLCTPSDQYRDDFSGFNVEDVTIETGAPECASRLCLVNNFNGRTDCPYGQPEPPEATPFRACTTTETHDPVTVAVASQLTRRSSDDAVYCSCRCDGPGPGPFCACPGGFACTPVVANGEDAALAGSYCVKDGTAVPVREIPRDRCTDLAAAAPRPQGCGDP